MAKRKQHPAAFKAQVAWAARKGDRAVNAVAAQCGAHPALIHDGQQRLRAGAAAVCAGRAKAAAPAEGPQAELSEQVGRLQLGLEWVNKKAAALL